MGLTVSNPQVKMADITDSSKVPNYEELPSEAKGVLSNNCEAITKSDDFRADISEAKTCYTDGAERAKAAALVSKEETDRKAFEAIAANWQQKAGTFSEEVDKLKELDSNPSEKAKVCDSINIENREMGTAEHPLSLLLQDGLMDQIAASKRKVCENKY